MGDGEKCLILQTCCLPTLSRAALQKDLVVCLAGFEMQYFAANWSGLCLNRDVLGGKGSPLYLTKNMHWQFCWNDYNEAKV